MCRCSNETLCIVFPACEGYGFLCTLPGLPGTSPKDIEYIWQFLAETPKNPEEVQF
jgi:hypothetical protein